MDEIDAWICRGSCISRKESQKYLSKLLRSTKYDLRYKSTIQKALNKVRNLDQEEFEELVLEFFIDQRSLIIW